MGSDPLEASRFHWVFGLAGEGQTPFQIGSTAQAFGSHPAADERYRNQLDRTEQQQS